MALQRVGDADVTPTVRRSPTAGPASRPYVQRAAVAGGRRAETAEDGGQRPRAAIEIVDRVTRQLRRPAERRSDEFKTLRQALAYCWSVVVGRRSPSGGSPAWNRGRVPRTRTSAGSSEENLKKARLARDSIPGWVARALRDVAWHGLRRPSIEQVGPLHGLDILVHLEEAQGLDRADPRCACLLR